MEDVIKARESIATIRKNNTGPEDGAETTVQSEGLYCRRWAMTGKKNEELNQTILAVARESPGGSIAKLIDAVLAQIPVGSKPPSSDAIHRRIAMLQAHGYLRLKEQTVVLPTAKALKEGT